MKWPKPNHQPAANAARAGERAEPAPSMSQTSPVKAPPRRGTAKNGGSAAVLVWQEGATAADVYGQNINADGSLGSAACDADVNGSGSVEVGDMLAVLAAWGVCPGALPCPEDINGDLRILVDDFLAVLSAWGPCP